jgi:SNF2 family DNA or RNA helicase
MDDPIIQEFDGVKFLHEQGTVQIIFDTNLFDSFEKGDTSDSEDLWLLYEYCKNEFYINGKAHKLKSGFSVLAHEILDKDEEVVSTLFMMPKPLVGSIEIKSTGLNAANKDYKLRIRYTEKGQRVSLPYKTSGYVLKTRSRIYSLNKKQEEAFRIYRAYEQALDLKENDHYHLAAAIKVIGCDNLRIEENRFKSLNIEEVNKVGLNVTRLDSGELLLEPNLKGFSFHDEEVIRRELNYIKEEKQSTLHIGRNLVQLDINDAAAVQEINQNNLISKEEAEDFLNNPASFIDAAKVDLDEGFSYRVQGVSEFTLVNFGDYDEIDNDWFIYGEHIPIENFEAHIKSESELDEFYQKAIKTYESNTQNIIFNGKEFIIPNREELSIRIERKREELRISENEEVIDEEISSSSQIGFDIKSFEEDNTVASQYHLYDIPLETFKDLTFQPFEHQRVAIEWIYNLYMSSLTSEDISGGILADDMGLGKTLSSLVGLKSISIYEKLKKGELEKSFLVVAPLSLLNNWKEEVYKFFNNSPFTDIVVLNTSSDLNTYRLTSGLGKTYIKEGISIEDSKIRYALKIGSDFGEERLDIPGRLIITTYETLRNYQFSLAKIPFYAVIFDEAQRIKNPNTLATRAAKALNTQISVLATGTPVENNLEEYWCLMDTANPKLLGTRKQFKEMYVDPTKEEHSEAIKIELGKKLYNKSGPFLIRRTKEELKDKLGNLPNKVIYKGMYQPEFSYLRMLDKQMTVEQVIKYEEVRSNHSSTGNALVNLSRLRSCMLHPRLTFTKNINHMTDLSSNQFWDESAKLQALREVINDVSLKNEKLLIFVISRNMQYLMKKWIKIEYDINPDIISGETKVEAYDYDETRLGMIDKFSKKEGFNVIILSPLAAGVGLNVTAANHVFHLERHWNPAKEAQANDRAYRIGQEKEVSIYYPISKHPKYESFDIKLDGLLSRKTFTKDVLMTYPKMSEKELADQIWD